MNRNPDDYDPTDTDRVYARSMGVSNTAIAEARKLAAAFDADVYVSMGPYRGHDVRFDARDLVHPENPDRIFLDYYSVRPGFQHTESIIQDIEGDLAGSEEEATA